MNVNSLQDVKRVRPVVSEEQAGIKFFSFLADLLRMDFERGQKLPLCSKSTPLGISHGVCLSQDQM